MSGDESLLYWSRDTSHSSSHHYYGDGISDNKTIEGSMGNERRVYRSLDTSHSSYINRGGYHGSDVDICGSMSQDNIQYSL